MSDTATRHLREAESRERAGDLDGALVAARKAFETSGRDVRVRPLLGRLLLALGRPAEAHAELLAAWTPGDLDLQVRLVDALAPQIDRADDPALEDHVLRALDFPNIDPGRLARVAAARLLHVHAPDGDTSSPDLDALAGDAFLRRLLGAVFFTNADLERLLTAARRALLLEVADTGGIPPGRLPLIVGLALQGFANEYAFHGDEAEARLVEGFLELQPRLAAGGDTDGLLATTLVAAMYLSPADQPAAAELAALPADAWPPEIRPLIERTLLEPAEERRLAAQIPSLSPVADETSRAVRAQYEANPYPRWLGLDHRAPVDFRDDLRARLPHADLDGLLPERPAEMLVAGGGTGRQPLSVALAYAPVAVTAVDLSRASLAYAARMAARLGVESVEFRHGDLLELHRLGRRYPVIWCSGVLHHMRDPVAGWTSLREALAPGGVMNVGLYSEIARRSVVTARAVVEALDLGDDPHALRTFRRDVLAGRFGDRLDEFLRLNDFYSLSGVRDLVFHVQEHRFTLPRIAEILDDLGLAFLGFHGLPRAAADAYRRAFPDDPSLTDLGNWDLVERKNPTLFLGMYNMWLRRAD